jgi:hypothetical protein
MANDVNCPMCGKANPAGSVTCQFCGARIVPMGSAPAPSNPAPEDDTEGWLRRLRGETPAQTPPQAPTSPPFEQPTEPAAQEEEVPDWLARIRERSRTETTQPEPEEEKSPDSGASPDWLTGSSAADEKAAAPANANDDWLTRLRSPDESDQAPAAPTSPTPAAPESNWQSFTPEATENNADETASFSSPDQLRDWLRSLGDDNTPVGEPPASEGKETPPPISVPAEQPAEANDVPDWLREFDTEPPAAPIDSLSSPDSGEIPGSLPGQPETPLSIPPAGQIPDWLSAFENPEAPTPATSPAAEQAFNPEDLLNTPSGPFVSGQNEWDQPPAGEGPAAQNQSDLPDWLRNVAPQQSTAKPETPAPAETPAWLAVFDSNASKSQAAETAGADAQSSGETISPFAGEDLPRWLSEKPAGQESGQAGAPAPASGLGEGSIARLPEKLSLDEEEMPSLPDWLGEAQAEETAPAPVPTAEGIEPAQLPGWLQAMRPVEAVVSESVAAPEDNQRAERAGPLVGLRGLLTPENLVTQYQKPPTLSVKLRLSDKQRINASLLENILAEESQSKPLRKERAQAPQTLVRVLVGLLLIAVLAITLFSGGPAGINTPILYQAETVQFNSLVNSLPDGAPVLLAFDYEASLAGEMNLSAAPVIDHLIAKQARLVIVSTIPAGPILGQQLIEAAAQKQPGYSLANKTINLGYMAGGATSLQEFALDPQKTTPYALNATEGDIQVAHAWENQALVGVTRLQDFAAIIVLTDNAETGRAWVEQVQPNLGNTPMLAVVSAQAAPVMQPYYESSQIKGMVAGLAGGMTYEQLRQVPGTAHTYWSAFQAGLLTAMAFIVIGILFQGVLALFPPSKAKREA